MDWDDDTELTPIPQGFVDETPIPQAAFDETPIPQAAFDETTPLAAEPGADPCEDTDLVIIGQRAGTEVGWSPPPRTPACPPASRRRAAVYTAVKRPGTST